jgi:hypothetical protein
MKGAAPPQKKGGIKMEIKYRELKTRDRVTTAHIDADITHKNERNKLKEVSEIKKYLFEKYGTLTDVSNYSFEDTNLFVDLLLLQGYSERFIYRTYGAKKQKTDWNKKFEEIKKGGTKK